MTELEQKHYNLNRKIVQEAKNTEYPDDDFEGRGIVTCGGSEKYFVLAYVMIRLLRKLGCTLPVQIWYLGENEINDNMREIVAEMDNVELVDAFEIRKKHPMQRLGGWESKVFSIMYSPFKEVLFIDSDNVPIRNPEYLFNTPLYKETGALFWPDFGILPQSREIWNICGVPYRKEPEFESGQIVIDKSRCWDALLVTKHLNEHSDFYYKAKDGSGKGYIWGDKDTFHMAWHMVNRKYSIIPKRVKGMPHTMLQHDGSSRPIFQHRNFAKWKLFGYNPRIVDFKNEEECFDFLDELRKKWKSKEPVDKRRVFEEDYLENMYQDIVQQKFFLYKRLGFDQRIIELQPDFKIGRGKNKNESKWELIKEGNGVKIMFKGRNGISSKVKYQYRNMWAGDSVQTPCRIQLKAAKG